MEALGLKEETKPATGQMPVSLKQLADLTGFPVEFIKRELLLEDRNFTVEELREKVLQYLDTKK